METIQELKEKRVAIIGYGHQGKECLELIKGTVPVTALIDPQLANAKPAGFDGNIYASVEEAIVDGAPFDIGIVCVPHSLHLDVTKKLLDAGKSVIKEKPLAFKAQDAKELTAYARERGLPVMTICQRNADPLFAAAHDSLHHIGTPYSFLYRYFMRQEKTTSGWRAHKSLAEGGVLLDMGYHAVDIIRGFFGVPDKTASMLTYAKPEMEKEKLEDYVTAQASFNAAHVVGTMILGRHYGEKQEVFEILGTKGTMRIEPKKQMLITDLSGAVILDAKTSVQGKDMYLKQLREYIRNIENPDYYLPHMANHVNNVSFVERLYSSNTLRQTFFASAKTAKTTPTQTQLKKTKENTP